MQSYWILCSKIAGLRLHFTPLLDFLQPKGTVSSLFQASVSISLHIFQRTVGRPHSLPFPLYKIQWRPAHPPSAKRQTRYDKRDGASSLLQSVRSRRNGRPGGGESKRRSAPCTGKRRPRCERNCTHCSAVHPAASAAREAGVSPGKWSVTWSSAGRVQPRNGSSRFGRSARTESYSAVSCFTTSSPTSPRSDHDRNCGGVPA